ncbi:MAG: hypothetical protein E7436_01590 [Ruminococcaceae bacterium]|nr:hypothetical protein [Oscillospiraceae bacterium]
MTGTEILVIVIIAVIVLWVRSSTRGNWKGQYGSFPRMEEIRRTVAKKRRGTVYTDRICVDGIEVVFRDHGLPDLTLQQAKDLAQYLASAMTKGTRYALIKARAESNWRPPHKPSGAVTVVTNSTGAYVFEGTALDAPSVGTHIGWGFFATTKRVSGDGIKGEVEYHRSLGG